MTNGADESGAIPLSNIRLKWGFSTASSINLYGAPALSLKEFRNYKQDLIIGASLQITAPTGQYDSSKLVNLSTNRWSFKPEIGFSKAVGDWTGELQAGATFFSDNTDFFGGKTRSQKALYSLQGHAIYAFNAGVKRRCLGLSGCHLLRWRAHDNRRYGE
jgi:hypothetical protein